MSISEGGALGGALAAMGMFMVACCIGIGAMPGTWPPTPPPATEAATEDDARPGAPGASPPDV